MSFKILMKDSHGEIEFQGTIGKDPRFPDDPYVDAPGLLKELKEMGKVEKLSIYLNSPGGDVYQGFQIANRLDALREKGQIGRIETHAEGVVASAATLTFLKGDRRVMRNGSRFMIHMPKAVMLGLFDAKSLREQAGNVADRLDQTTEEAIDLYEASSAMTRDEIRAAMEKETYFTPADAEAAGFATEVVEPYAVAACMSRELQQEYCPGLPSELTITPQKIREARLRRVESLRINHEPNIIGAANVMD